MRPDVPSFSFSNQPTGKEEEKKKIRTEAEASRLKDKIRFVARLFSENFGFRLLPGQGWAAGLSKEKDQHIKEHPELNLEDLDDSLVLPEIMTYPEKDLLTRSEDYILGVFRHEIGHVKHSDYRALIEARKKVEAEGYRFEDVFLAYNACEDGRSNVMEAEISPTARYRLDYYVSEDLPEFTETIKQMLPPIKFTFLCFARGYAGLNPDFDFEELRKQITEPEVQEAFDKAEKAVEEYIHERQGLRAFREPFWEVIWPIYKELIKKTIEQPPTHPPGGNGGQGGEEGYKPGGGRGGSIDWDKLSDEQKEKIREAIRERLSEEEKKIIDIIKPQSWETKEDKTGEGPLIEVRGISEEEAQKMIQEDKEERETAPDERPQQPDIQGKIKTEDQLRVLRERRTGMKESEQQYYKRYLDKVKKYISILEEKIKEIFPPQKESDWEGTYRRGKRIDRHQMAREIPSGEGRIFQKKEHKEQREIAFTLLIDISGSMAGQEINEAVKATILMAEALSKANIPFEILAFASHFQEIKKFDDRYFGNIKTDVIKLLYSTGGGTDIGFAVDASAKRLQKKMTKENAYGSLIVITDGDPAPNHEHSGPEWELGKVVQKWGKRMPVIGVGIGQGMERTIKTYFKENAIAVPDVSKLPRELLKIIKSQLGHLKKE